MENFTNTSRTFTSKTNLSHTKNGIPEKTRGNVIAVLQGLLGSGIDLMLQTKHAHWNVKGPNFIALHHLFDEVHGEMEELVDLIAERITQFGGMAEGTSGDIVKNSSLPKFPQGISTEKNYIEHLSHSLAFFGESLREGVEKLDEMKDPGTVDILTQISRSIDKNLWFVESHLTEQHTAGKGVQKVPKKTKAKGQGHQFSSVKNKKRVNGSYAI